METRSIYRNLDFSKSMMAIREKQNLEIEKKYFSALYDFWIYIKRFEKIREKSSK